MGDGRRGEPVGLFQALLEGVGQAISDIRHKVVEEGWFGRDETLTRGAGSLYRPVMEERPTSFEELWAPRLSDERAEASRDRGCDLDGSDHGR